jgi:hypothetical protein
MSRACVFGHCYCEQYFGSVSTECFYSKDIAKPTPNIPIKPLDMTTPTPVQSTLSERGKTHGDFIQNGIFMQELKAKFRSYYGWDNLAPYQKEAIDMICHKLGRIMCGNPNMSDHWHDIAGYATLCENIILTGKSHPSD